MIVELTDLLRRYPFELELGRGTTKENAVAVGVNLREAPSVDIVADLIADLRAAPNTSVGSNYGEILPEHIDDSRILLSKAARILRPGSSFRAVPHFFNPGFYNDPIKRSFCRLDTLACRNRWTPFKQQGSQYGDPMPVDLVSVHLAFKSGRPFYLRYALKKALTFWVNIGIWAQALYEETVNPFLPCYELDLYLARAEAGNATW